VSASARLVELFTATGPFILTLASPRASSGIAEGGRLFYSLALGATHILKFKQRSWVAGAQPDALTDHDRAEKQDQQDAV